MSVCIWIWVSPFFFQHICLQDFVSSSVIGQNTMKGPETCKNRQIFSGRWGEEDWENRLLNDHKGLQDSWRYWVCSVSQHKTYEMFILFQMDKNLIMCRISREMRVKMNTVDVCVVVGLKKCLKSQKKECWYSFVFVISLWFSVSEKENATKVSLKLSASE